MTHTLKQGKQGKQSTCNHQNRKEHRKETCSPTFQQREVIGREHLRTILLQVRERAKVRKIRDRHKVYEIPCAFDIETSSFMDNGEPRACMYIWMMGIDGYVWYGRSWGEWLEDLEIIKEVFTLSLDLRLVVYVHNLAFDFTFFAPWLSFTEVFSVDRLKPLYAVTDWGLEFRCSYLLSGFSLAKVGEHLVKYPVKKMVGDLDYSLLRTAETPLTEKELQYCINDVRVVMSFIREEIERNQRITNIPLTKTGYVRRFVRSVCYGTIEGSKHSYRSMYKRLMGILTITEGEYLLVKRAFMGGFTHANAHKVISEVEAYRVPHGGVYRVASYDFSSCYPAVLVSELYPMSKPEVYTPKDEADLKYCLENYCCIFDVCFENLRAKVFNDHPLSRSKCWDADGVVVEDNGRVVKCNGKLYTSITNVDYEYLSVFYDWDKMSVANFHRYLKGYLPKPLIWAILKKYGDKTTLKGVVGKETEYMAGKADCNSVYGFMATDIAKVTWDYLSDWEQAPYDLNGLLEKYNESNTRTTSYLWGCFCTAYARRNLFTGIYALGDDYCYADTDSVKVENYEKHLPYFDWYNKRITEKMDRAMDTLGLPRELTRPKTIKGVEKPLGVWDFEGVFDFKTLGAKRYLKRDVETGEYEITVAGVNKKKALDYLLSLPGDPFDNFTFELTIPKGYSGKTVLHYIQDETTGSVTDYLGQTSTYHERASINLSESDYQLKLYPMYAEYLLGMTVDKYDMMGVD